MKDKTQFEPASKGDLTNGLAKLDVKISTLIETVTGLAETVTRLAINGAKSQADIREIKETLATKVATKDDISRVMNNMDVFAGEARDYRRKDLDRGHMLMEQHDKLENHEGRLVLLETPK
ncbi:MAG: hypothetical protein KKH28_09945 [Elusimicrobia bacterium]|nr:hypothetical protein [Elusimicrobiota bacterium]